MFTYIAAWETFARAIIVHNGADNPTRIPYSDREAEGLERGPAGDGEDRPFFFFYKGSQYTYIIHLIGIINV